MAVLLAAGFEMGSIEGNAATITWDAVGANGTLEDGSGTWNTVLANWTLDNGVTNLQFVSGDNVIFGGGSSGTAGTVQLGVNITSGTLTFALTSGGSYTISPAVAQTLTINSGIIANESAVITANIILGGAQNWTAAATKTLTISGGVTNGGNLLTLDGAGNTVISGIIGGAGGVTQSGSGTTTLSGENTYTGSTSVTGGTLLLQHAQALGTGVAEVSVSNGGTLSLSSTSGTPDFGTKTLTLNGNGSAGQSGTLVNSAGTNSYSGDIIIGSSTAISVDSGTLDFGTVNPITGTGDLTLSGSGIGSFAADFNFTGDLTKTGNGTWTLYGNGIREGATSILGGTLNLNGEAIGYTSGTTLGAATLNFSGIGGIGGIGGLTLDTNTSSSVVVAPFSALTIGGITRNAGATTSFSISSGGTITSTVAGSGTNRILGYATVTDSTSTGLARRSGGPSGGSIIRFDSTLAAVLAAGTNSANTDYTTLTNAGTLNWTNALTARSVNSLTIDATGNPGQITSMGAASNVLTLSSGALQFIGSENGTLTGGQVGAANSEVIVHQHGTGVFTLESLVSSGTGRLIKLGTGTLILTAANTYTGTTTVNEGTLQLNGGSAIADTSAVVMANVTTAILRLNNSETIGSLAGGGATGGNVNLQGNTLTVGDATSTTYAGVISGSAGGALTKVGAGTLILTAANTYPGATTVSGGTLQLGDGTNGNGSLNTASSISVDAGATFAVNQTDIVTQGTDFSGSAITGLGGFEQAGSGTTIFTAANSYDGETIVSDGVFLVNGDQSTAIGDVIVSGDAMLGGTGKIGGDTTIGSTAILNAGDPNVAGGVGTLEFAGTSTGLALEAGSTWLVDLTQGTSGSSDRIIVGGELNLDAGNGSLLDFNFTPSFTQSNSYTIAEYGSLTGGWFTTSEGVWVDDQVQSHGGGSYRINYNDGGNFITLTAVPEPATVGLLGIALAGLFLRRMRMRIAGS